jgi:hypothetical protein
LNKLLYKYRAANKFFFDILINNQLYFSTTSDFNDPFDGQLKPNEFALELKNLGCKEDLSQFSRHSQYVEDSINRSAVLSLSTTSDNILMWSHYANSHKGVCLGFNNNLTNSFVDWDEDVQVFIEEKV